MTKKILVMVVFCLATAACESSPETNSNANQATPAATAQSSPATVPSPSATPSAPVAQIKAGDKVKIMVKGVATDATVVSIDDKAAMATVKVAGESKERIVPISELKQ